MIVSSRRLGLWGEAAGIAVLAVVALSFPGIQDAGGSGYLGAFIAGLIVGNMQELRIGMHTHQETEMRFLVANLADVAVLLVFITLGANLPFGTIADEWLPALAVLATLLFVARPIAVLLSLLPDRRGKWTRQEIVFIGWTRETGVVPAALAGIIVAEGVADADLVVVCVAMAIIVTLTLQASTKRWLAHRLGLTEQDPLAAVGAGSHPALPASTGPRARSHPGPRRPLRQASRYP